MLDQLSALRSGVDHDPVTFGGNPLLLRQLFGDLYHVTKYLSLLFGDIVERGNMLSGDDQDMHWRHRADITEGNNLIVFINSFAGDYPGDDLTKNTIHRATLLFSGFKPDDEHSHCTSFCVEGK